MFLFFIFLCRIEVSWYFLGRILYDYDDFYCWLRWGIHKKNKIKKELSNMERTSITRYGPDISAPFFFFFFSWVESTLSLNMAILYTQIVYLFWVALQDQKKKCKRRKKKSGKS